MKLIPHAVTAAFGTIGATDPGLTLVERYGALGMLALVMWWMMFQQTQAIKDLTKEIQILRESK